MVRGCLQRMQAGIPLHAGRTCSDGSIVQTTSLGRTSGLLIGLGHTHQSSSAFAEVWLQHRFKISVSLQLGSGCSTSSLSLSIEFAFLNHSCYRGLVITVTVEAIGTWVLVKPGCAIAFICTDSITVDPGLTRYESFQLHTYTKCILTV